MTTTDFTYLFNNSDAVTEQQTMELEVVVSEFPYFQSARAIRLKALQFQNSFRYNLELKKLASHTTDRGVLFDFITSENFRHKTKDVHDIEVIEIEVVPAKWVSIEEKLEQSLVTSIKSAEIEEDNPVKVSEFLTEKTPEEPVGFSKIDKFSFNEWLQLTATKPIVREVDTEDKNEISSVKNKKMELIDKFIETNPKIISDKNAPLSNSLLGTQTQDSSTLMTETLAKVYLEQKKYSKAIDAYEILILKYPEKSVFFADRIENVKKLQQNNI